MKRLLNQTLPHLLLGALISLPWLLVPDSVTFTGLGGTAEFYAEWWMRLLPLAALPQALVWALVREHAQAVERDRWRDEQIVPTPSGFGYHAYERAPARFWPPNWLWSLRRWADIGEIVAGAALVAAIGVAT